MTDLIKEIRQTSKWKGKDDFPSTETWKKEVNKWLSFIKDKGQLNKFKTRLKCKPALRDEALSEIKVAYFLEKYLNYKIIEWEPLGQNNHKGEFTIKLKSGLCIFCEVKSPGWEGEVLKDGKDYQRLKQPKYITGDARWVDNTDVTKYMIEKTYPKLVECNTNLLILVDDLFFSNKDDEYHGVEKALFHNKLQPPHADWRSEGCFVTDQYKNLSCLATLNIEKPAASKSVHYYWRAFKNKNSVNKIPDSFIKNFELT